MTFSALLHVLSSWLVEKSPPPPKVNNLFREIPFSQEDEKHEHILESSLLRRRTKGNLAWCFHSFLQVLERGVVQKISYLDEKSLLKVKALKVIAVR